MHSDSCRSVWGIPEGCMRSQGRRPSHKNIQTQPYCRCQVHSHRASFSGAAPSLANGESPWLPWFTSRDGAPGPADWTGVGGCHMTTVVPVRIPIAPGNWELRPKDGWSTWAALVYRGYLAWKLPMTTDQFTHNVRENTEDAQKEAARRWALPAFLAAVWFPVLVPPSYKPGLGVLRPLVLPPIGLYLYIYFFLS